MATRGRRELLFAFAALRTVVPHSKEILHGPRQECSREDGRPDPDGSLALRSLPKADQETGRRPLLVLPRAQDDEIPRPTTLHKCQIACSASGSVGRQRSGGIRVLLSNPRWERRLLRFLELSGVGRLAGDEDVEETRRPGWTGGSRGGEGHPVGLLVPFSFLFLLFLFFPFFLSRGPHASNFAHSTR